MKYFNRSKINIRLIAIIEIAVKIIRPIFSNLHRLVEQGHTAIVLIDGFLIGDSVLLRPLLGAIVEHYGKTRNVIVVSGSHASQIYADMLPAVQVIELQFPWATYDYSLRNLAKLVTVWIRLFTTKIEVALEARGDFRSIAWTYLACPNQLIGFDFTGGSALLTDIVPDDGKIAHLFEHSIRLGQLLNLEVTSERLRTARLTPSKTDTTRIGVSYSGSQPMKRLPEEIGLQLLLDLSKEVDAELWYIQSPHDNYYTGEKLLQELGGNLRIFKGTFEQYYYFLQTLDCFIGMDSAGGHLCAMFGIPSVVIFGSQIPSYSSPVGDHPLLCVETERSLACRPCDGITCVSETYQECLMDIDRKSIIRFVQESLIR